MLIDPKGTYDVFNQSLSCPELNQTDLIVPCDQLSFHMFIRVASLVEYKAFAIQSLCSLKGKVRFHGSALIFSDMSRNVGPFELMTLWETP